ncbi:MAG TPA: type II toxin-antitoxin system VapC family toxin [Opitutaceae bacterium]
MSYLLDTNVCVGVLRGNARVCRRLEETSPSDCAISAVTAFELRTGAKRCSQPERELKKLEKFWRIVAVLPFDEDSAEEAARVRHELESNGETIGPYDLLIAGHALGAGRELVTNNTREFARVGSLKLVDWRS